MPSLSSFLPISIIVIGVVVVIMSIVIINVVVFIFPPGARTLHHYFVDNMCGPVYFGSRHRDDKNGMRNGNCNGTYHRQPITPDAVFGLIHNTIHISKPHQTCNPSCFFYSPVVRFTRLLCRSRFCRYVAPIAIVNAPHFHPLHYELNIRNQMKRTFFFYDVRRILSIYN